VNPQTHDVDGPPFPYAPVLPQQPAPGSIRPGSISRPRSVGARRPIPAGSGRLAGRGILGARSDPSLVGGTVAGASLRRAGRPVGSVAARAGLPSVDPL